MQGEARTSSGVIGRDDNDVATITLDQTVTRLSFPEFNPLNYVSIDLRKGNTYPNM